MDIPASDRWVRDAQRTRIHVALDTPLTELPPSGARATVRSAGEHEWLSCCWLQAQLIDGCTMFTKAAIKTVINDTSSGC